MKYGIISDIHGNLEALKEVLAVCKQESVDKYLCLGDIVGYGPNPNECIEIVQDIGAVCVAGNHDWATTARLDATYFTPDGKSAVTWTREHLTMEGFGFLNGLPITEKTEEFILVHGTLFEPELFRYQNIIAKAPNSFSLMDRQLCFVGHTHAPLILIQTNDNVYSSSERELEIAEAAKYIVNVGSVGQPRDGNPLASFCIYDTDIGMIDIRRVKYDI
ncbi:MAG: metallophosphatase family protein, partial [Candidatus Omnitrophica bacterium]|nr:metallophosphatase family protein [Candidatus Omnitrophota bacterium]